MPPQLLVQKRGLLEVTTQHSELFRADRMVEMKQSQNTRRTSSETLARGQRIGPHPRKD
jgi:hypothetical protein